MGHVLSGYMCSIPTTVAPELSDDSKSQAEGLDLLKMLSSWDKESVPGC